LLATSQQKPESAFFKLVKGGLRAVDGLIGQSEPKNYGVETPVATIGVRGTAFDVRYCGDDCKDEADTSGAPQNGLYTAVSEGSIGVKNDSGESVTKAGEYSYVASRHVAVQHLAAAPRALRHMALPSQLKARADKTRAQIQAKRQAHRQQVLQQRRQQPERKAGTPAEKAASGKAEGMSRAERRQQRLQERRAGNAPAREQRQQEQTQGAGKAKERQTLQQENAVPASRAERRQERLKQRQERQAEKAKPDQAATSARPAQEKPDAKAGCKDKKKKRRRGKDKDKCGDG
jgi:hypothetical protein